MTTTEASRLTKFAPLQDTLENRRVRFSRMVDAQTVEVTDDAGKVLPDWRHIEQVRAK
jgi:hypothetical protein